LEKLEALVADDKSGFCAAALVAEWSRTPRAAADESGKYYFTFHCIALLDYDLFVDLCLVVNARESVCVLVVISTHSVFLPSSRLHTHLCRCGGTDS
jgi:hypothetical protein